MTMHGAFDGVDAVLTWHPMPENNHGGGSLACVTVKYAFTGTAAHAAAAPWEGRSALDAAELMNVGVQFLREHILPTCRIHYAVTGNGGDAPNVVQPSAELLYSIRAESSEVFERCLRPCYENCGRRGSDDRHRRRKAHHRQRVIPKSS